MWKIKNILFSLSNLDKIYVTSNINGKIDDKRLYLFPIVEWQDSKHKYDYEILLDDNGDIVDFSWSYETFIDVEGMFQ